MYVFDTNSIRQMFQFYPNRFKKLWDNINSLVEDGKIESVHEVFKELHKPKEVQWKEANKGIFTKVTSQEAEFIKDIFATKGGHFQACIRSEQLLKGMPVADPFIIAKAKINSGIVVTEETYSQHASGIPNICEHFKIKCVNFELVMEIEGWEF